MRKLKKTEIRTDFWSIRPNEKMYDMQNDELYQLQKTELKNSNLKKSY